MENQIKSCKNCRYLSWHYIKLRGGTFQRLNFCGHCVAGKMTRSQYEKIIKNCLCTSHGVACKFWEPVEIKLDERRESIENTLCNMARVLQEMAFTLEDDKEIRRQAQLCEISDK